jgi:poly(3-hydroxybutyrate) depolymerase
MNLLAYPTYQAMSDLMRPVSDAARFASSLLDTWPELGNVEGVRYIAATCAVLSLAGLTHKRLPFGIDRVQVDGREIEVFEEVVDSTPFCSLLHFRKDSPVEQPRVLMIAPMSGHFATLLRGTVRTMLPEHDVYITDWHNPRDVSLVHGRFGFAEFVQHVIDFLERLGAGAHVLAICQPTVAALAAVALMAEDGNPAQPASMTLMAGPIDTRVNPTRVNELAKSRPIEWFMNNLISAVPPGFAGEHRRVYPGFVQLSAFLSMNTDRHASSLADMFYERARGEVARAAAIQVFYEEYFATMDLTEEFYIETVSTVFQQHALPLGTLEVAGRRVDPSAIRRTALLTVEGEKDDICAIGQTVAAHDLCVRLRPYLKTHHVQTGVGHYGVFNGRRWERQIYPLVRAVIHDNETMPTLTAGVQPAPPATDGPRETAATTQG